MKPYLEFVKEHAARERDVFLDLVREPHLLVPPLNRADKEEEGASFLTVRFKPRGPGGAGKDDVQGVLPVRKSGCAIVSGCRSTTRVVSFRYSSGDGGLFLNLPLRRGGSLKAQCFTSPWPPCMTAQCTPASQLFRYALVSPFGKCRLVSGMTNSLRIRLKQSSRSAFSNESGCVGGASFPSRNHSSIPQKCADFTFR